MIEPLTHVVKGSVSRYTALSTSTGNTRLGTFRNNFFTPVPRPTWMVASSSASSSSQESLARTDQCRIWSCCPVRHSIWCPSEEHNWELDLYSESRGRRLRSRFSTQRHLPRTSRHPSINLHAPRRHASLLPKESDHLPSSTHPEHAQTCEMALPVPVEIRNFSRYTLDRKLIFEEPDKALDAYFAVVNAGLLSEVSIDDTLNFARRLINMAVWNWSMDATAPCERWAAHIEEVLHSVSLPQDDSRLGHQELLKAKCLALRGDVEPATRLLERHPATSDAKGVERRELIELYNTAVVATYRAKRLEVFLKFIRRQTTRLAPIFFSDIRSGPIKRIFYLLLDHQEPFLRYDSRYDCRPAAVTRAWMDNILREVSARKPRPVVAFSLLQQYAEAGDLPGLEQKFQQLFSSPPSATVTNTLQPKHFRLAFFAISQANQPNDEAMQEWKDKLGRAGFPFDSSIYGHMLQYYARHDRAESVTALFEEIWAAGSPANLRVYQIGITYFARRGDSKTAEALLLRALDEGIQPDEQLLVTVMNAHAEAGTWAGVLKVNNYMKACGIKDTIATFNVMFKASHLLGVPYSVLVQEFDALDSNGLVPDSYTYSTIVQAAIDVGKLAAAFKHYREMAERSQDQPGLLTPHVFTILIHGCLRQGSFKRAVWAYRQMMKHGIRPTSVTLGKMMEYASSSGEGSKEGVAEIMEDVRARVGAGGDWKVPSFGKATWFEHICVPLMGAALNDGSVDVAKAAYQEVVAIGAQPSLTMNILLLDAYRRSGDVQGVLGLWPQIFDQALAIKNAGLRLQSDEVLLGGEDTDSAILVKAFSMYIDVLSSAGMHSEVALTCDRYREEGFKFDPHNWNHLVIAFIRAGNLDGAFDIISNILLPYREVSKRYKPTTTKERSSPRIFTPSYTPGIRSPASTRLTISPLRRTTQRVSRSRVTRKRLGKFPSFNPQDPGGAYRALFESLATSRHWAIHGIVNKILLTAVCRMEAGFPLRPLKPNETLLPANDDFDRPRAREQLLNIEKKYPRALTHIKAFKVSERRRLGPRFNSEYKLSEEVITMSNQVGTQEFATEEITGERDQQERPDEENKQGEAG